jgi:hypothetical protein
VRHAIPENGLKAIQHSARQEASLGGKKQDRPTLAVFRWYRLEYVWPVDRWRVLQQSQELILHAIEGDCFLGIVVKKGHAMCTKDVDFHQATVLFQAFHDSRDQRTTRTVETHNRKGLYARNTR